MRLKLFSFGLSLIVALATLVVGEVSFAANKSNKIVGKSVIKTETFEYSIGDKKFEGFIAYPALSSKTAKAPVVLVVHDWMGQGEFSKEKAKQLAEWGYVGFAVDIYGVGVRPKDGKEAGALAGHLKVM